VVVPSWEVFSPHPLKGSFAVIPMKEKASPF
jgi:hypothetical protein